MFGKASVPWNGAHLFKAFNCHKAINVANNITVPLGRAQDSLVPIKSGTPLSDSHAVSYVTYRNGLMLHTQRGISHIVR